MSDSENFEGRDVGSGISVIRESSDVVGSGPRLHRHPYAEVLIVQEGRGTFVLGEEEREVGAGEIAIAPAGMPHAFTNTGDGPLRQIDIHLSRTFDTEWL